MKRLREYLQAVLHADPRVEAWEDLSKVPVFLTREFRLWRAELLGRSMLLAVADPASELAPGEIAKRARRLAELFDGPVVLVADNMTAYQRGRFIEAAVPFIVPGNQLYLPHLGAVLGEHFRRRPLPQEKKLSPAAQVLVLRHLVIGDVDARTPGSLSKALGYSAMTGGRAIEELTSHGIADIHVRGRSKLILFRLPEEDVFRLAQPLLRSPVRAQHWFRARPIPRGFYGTSLPQDLVPGGESALAEISMLSAPARPCFAAGPSDWKRVQSGSYGDQVPFSEDPDFGVDVWWYEPEGVSGRREADRISLYLQFKDNPDERVAAAARQGMTEFAWFVD